MAVSEVLYQLSVAAFARMRVSLTRILANAATDNWRPTYETVVKHSVQIAIQSSTHRGFAALVFAKHGFVGSHLQQDCGGIDWLRAWNGHRSSAFQTGKRLSRCPLGCYVARPTIGALNRYRHVEIRISLEYQYYVRYIIEIILRSRMIIT